MSDDDDDDDKKNGIVGAMKLQHRVMLLPGTETINLFLVQLIKYSFKIPLTIIQGNMCLISTSSCFCSESRTSH